jgi:nitrogenase iron protein NifH
MSEHPPSYHTIAFLGKGGVGKSTLISNVSAALAEAGFDVMQVGCDPKGDSCLTLNGGVPVPTVFELLRDQREITVETVRHRGFKGISCLELGDPKLAGDCATAETGAALTHLERIGAFEAHSPDFILFDISGDGSCSGYRALLAQLQVQHLFVVTSADFMSLHAANAIYALLERLGDDTAPIPPGALIPNGIANSLEESLVDDFARQIRIRTLARIPRSLMVRQCELYGKTVIEASPLSNQSYFYRRLANQIVDEIQARPSGTRPVPLSPEKLRAWAHAWGDAIYMLENGLVSEGAAI